MNSKERVQAALKREPVDRVPIYMWFHPDTAGRLGQVLEIPPERVAETMGNDVRQTWVGNNYAMEGITHEREGEGHVDFWGVEWVKVGPFNQIRRSPLAEADADAILRYEYPYAHVDQLLRNMEPVAALAGDFFIGCDVSPCVFEMACRLRGMENAILDLAADPGLAEEMLGRAGAFALLVRCAAWPKPPAPAFPWTGCLPWTAGRPGWTGDDVGGQQAMIMSPRCWRDLIRPHLARVVAAGRARGLWVAYHSCGAIRPIIPDLIEIGVNVLNPVQSNCPGMDPLELKREFGQDLAFMGGVDTQGLLPNGTAAEVRRATEQLLEGMTADGGGYILAASHTVPPETPLENVFALYEVAGVSRGEIFERAAGIRSQVSQAPSPVRRC
jgi:uroporphyrinogen decarboxylase